MGGGLGVDYDGSNSGRGSSVDYSLEEYADPVIEDADHLAAASLNVDFNATRQSVQAVFEQLFDHIGWPLNHFACGNFVNDARVELLNSRHDPSVV